MEPLPGAQQSAVALKSAPFCRASCARTSEDFPAGLRPPRLPGGACPALPCPTQPWVPRPDSPSPKVRSRLPGRPSLGPDPSAGTGQPRLHIRDHRCGLIPSLSLSVCRSPQPFAQGLAQGGPSLRLQCKGVRTSPPSGSRRTKPSAASDRLPQTWNRTSSREARPGCSAPRGVPGRQDSRTEPLGSFCESKLPPSFRSKRLPRKEHRPPLPWLPARA